MSCSTAPKNHARKHSAAEVHDRLALATHFEQGNIELSDTTSVWSMGMESTVYSYDIITSWPIKFAFCHRVLSGLQMVLDCTPTDASLSENCRVTSANKTQFLSSISQFLHCEDL